MMHSISRYRSSAIVFFAISLCIFLFSKCINDEKDKLDATVTTNSYEKFVGSDKCISCHKAIYDTHVHTAHFLTSATASEQNVKGSFDNAKNKFMFSNGRLIAMQKKSDGLYQVAYIKGVEKKSQRFDMVIGSGTKGQSYGTWVQDRLFQLPITYFTSADQWSNSPGYPNKIAFNRPITSRCLECHATYVTKTSAEGIEIEEFDKNRMVLGVDCEKCHGSAEKHVVFQTQNPSEKKGKFIINPALFSRQQSLDMCAVCHGGRLQKTRPSFQFTAGDKLADYFLTDTTTKDVNSIDVHGNQYGLLASSKCFTMSKTLTCNNCHNTHENEKGNTALFSQRCISCHSGKQADAVLCKMTASIGAEINKNCTNCHMPKMKSMAIAVLLQGNNMPTSALIHTHLIKVYPEETKKILAFIKNK